MNALVDQPCFTVSGWTVEPRMDRLVRDGTTTPLEPRVMEVLVYLAGRRGEVVSRDELVSEVWRGTIVGDQPVYRSIAHLRKALGDDAQNPRYIATIPKRGYRLIADVDIEAAASSDDDRPGTLEGGFLRLPYLRTAAVALVLFAGGSSLMLHPGLTDVRSAHASVTAPRSIAVLPFVDMSGDRSQTHLGDGIADELIHALSNVSGLRVIARRSSFSFRGQDVDVKTLGRRLDVDAILEGSIRTSGERLRITAQLIDTNRGHYIWSTSYDREEGDALAIQDEIAESVVRTLRLNLRSEPAQH